MEKSISIPEHANESAILSRIKQLRLCLLVHSVLYYLLNTNMISDYDFDMGAKELLKLQTQYPELSNKVPEYYNAFKNWNGSSGYNLPLRDVWAMRKAQYLIDTYAHKKSKAS